MGFRSPIRNESDIVFALAKLTGECRSLGYSDQTRARVVTATSELVRNILKYADRGEVVCSNLDDGARVGLGLCVADIGPGIEDISAAMKDNFSTSGTLGLGLPGVKRLVDSFSIDSKLGEGTRITFEVWQT